MIEKSEIHELELAANELTQETVGEVLSSVFGRSQAALLALTEDQLRGKWSFRWNPDATAEWNMYQFYDHLESYKRACRTWEEHHHGTCCVVERVRDKYLMPRINEVMPFLRKTYRT